MRIFTTKRVNRQVRVLDYTQGEVWSEALKYSRAAIIVSNISTVQGITAAQIAWFKGILLPGLAANGDSVGYWEDLLKLNVMPDQFALVTTKTKNGEFEHLPSITSLSKSEMNELIVGSVAFLRDEDNKDPRSGERYGKTFHWVTLPDPELRK